MNCSAFLVVLMPMKLSAHIANVLESCTQMQTPETRKPNPNSKKCLTHTKYFLTRTSVRATTNLARRELAVAAMPAIHLVAEALADLVTSLKHSLVAVHHSVAVVVNDNNRAHLVVKM